MGWVSYEKNSHLASCNVFSSVDWECPCACVLVRPKDMGSGVRCLLMTDSDRPKIVHSNVLSSQVNCFSNSSHTPNVIYCFTHKSSLVPPL